jgi:hypothetical protein
MKADSGCCTDCGALTLRRCITQNELLCNKAESDESASSHTYASKFSTRAWHIELEGYSSFYCRRWLSGQVLIQHA